MDASALSNYSLKKGSAQTYHTLLVGQYGSDEYKNRDGQEESLLEMIQLSDTAGITSIHEMFAHIPYPDTKFFLTKGLLRKIKELIAKHKLNLLIVDCNLKPGQLRSLENSLKIRVLGRVELILDIFAMRANTKASALQVELAQLTYILPRLKGLGGVLSRLGGGIGTRGPGESMLETDRRHIRRRIQKIKKDLEKHSRHLANTRKNRSAPTFSLVGYTNAGKTSLVNKISNTPKKLFAEDRLFATLSSFSRKVYLGDIDYIPQYCILTDTVGFIQNLPANLIAAFRSTLDEIRFTDAIIMVIDASSSRLREEMAIVQAELEYLGVNDKKVFFYFNKDDLVFADDRKELETGFPNAIWGNTLSERGVADLRRQLFEYMQNNTYSGTGAAT